MKKTLTVFRMAGFLFAVFSAVVSRAQAIEIDFPDNPEHWKAKVVAQKKYSLENKKWNVEFEFTNVSGTKDRLMTSNDYFMYRVTAFVLNEAGVRVGEVKTRTFSAFPLHNRYSYAEPGRVIWTVCDIREWLMIDKPGWYEIHADRLLNMKGANDNAVGLPVEKVMKISPFKIEMVR